MLDDLNELKTFERIVALGSLSAAARELQIGLGVVSKRLISLERRTGVRLVNRTTRRLAATDDGLALYRQVERMLEALRDAEVRLASGREEPIGLLRVTAPVSFGRIHLAPIAAELSGRHPGLSVELMLSDAVLDLVHERIDLAVRIGSPQDSRAVMRKLSDNWRVLVAAPDYLDSRGRPASPNEFAGHDFLRYDDGVNPWRIENTKGETFELRAHSRLRADNGDVVHDWALAGRGVMLKSLADVAPDLASGSLERVLPDWRSGPAPIYALFPSASLLPLKTRVLVDALVRKLAQAPFGPAT